MKRRWITVVGVLVTLVSLYMAFKGAHLGKVLETLRGANLWWAVPLFGSTMLSIWIRAYRWRVMLDPVRRVTLTHAYSATMIGYMANNILPMRLGELVRAYSIGRSSGVSKSAAFATIVIERAFDLLALLLFLAWALLRYSVEPWVKISGYVALGICAVLFLLMALARWKREGTLRVLGSVTRRLPERAAHAVQGVLQRFLEGTEVLGRWQHIAWTMVLSLGVWLAVALSFHCGFLAFDLALPLDACLVMTVVCALAVMLPSGPGFVGTFEMGAVYGLLIFPNTTREIALSYAVFYHAVQFIPITLLGFYHLWRENLSLTRAVKDEEGAPA